MSVGTFSAKILENCTLWVCILEGPLCLPRNLEAKVQEELQGEQEEQEVQEVQVKVTKHKLVKEKEEEHRQH